MRQRKINKYFRVLLGDIFIVPFLGPALVYLTGVGKFGCNWLEWFARGQGIWRQIFENVKSPPQALPPPPPPGLTLMGDVTSQRSLKRRTNFSVFGIHREMRRFFMNTFFNQFRWGFNWWDTIFKRLIFWIGRYLSVLISTYQYLCQQWSKLMALVSKPIPSHMKHLSLKGKINFWKDNSFFRFISWPLPSTRPGAWIPPAEI